MDAQSRFADWNRPEMEIMNPNLIAIGGDCIYIAQQLFRIDFLRWAFHKDRSAFFDCWGGGRTNNNWEYKSAYRIRYLCLREKINDSSGNTNSNTHEHISKHMQIGSLNIHIFAFYFAIIITWAVMAPCAMTMGMPMAVIVTAEDLHLYQVED